MGVPVGDSILCTLFFTNDEVAGMDGSSNIRSDGLMINLSNLNILKQETMNRIFRE